MSRLRGEHGFTLIELLMGMIIGLVVLYGGLLLMDRSTQLAGATRQRVDATQRGRLAMDAMTRDLRSQVCLDPSTPPIVSASDSSITYYANTGGANAVPEKHVLALTSGNLVLQRYVGSGSPLTFPSSPTSTRTLLENVSLVSGTPLFTYWQWGSGTPTLPDSQLVTPLSATDVDNVVKIDITFIALPDRGFKNTTGSATISDSVFVRIADATNPTQGPRCT
ncbi:MAG TPA: prepilin-type N-terminal cleavage/methylation domain-containing protein [Solirubrobacteraceae bacterium]|nr:prepilin-type N-terminal cleavage/methylation domain-containing protein [Solirubrobacteraceae bacterium]